MKSVGKSAKKTQRLRKKTESSWQETVEKGNGIAESVVMCP